MADRDEPKVIAATVRNGVDELHIECRMSDGQKGAFVRVDNEFETLAHGIAAVLNDTGMRQLGIRT